MGRNMFGGRRGPWGDEPWNGWWGDDPPSTTPVFVLTHHPREPLPMEGGTTFHFVTDGIESALEQAQRGRRRQGRDAPGGAHVAQQYLRAGLVDELGSTSFRSCSAAGRGSSTTSAMPCRGWSRSGPSRPPA